MAILQTVAIKPHSRESRSEAIRLSNRTRAKPTPESHIARQSGRIAARARRAEWTDPVTAARLQDELTAARPQPDKRTVAYKLWLAARERAAARAQAPRPGEQGNP